MAEDRALEFLYELVENDQLRQQLASADAKPSAWVQVGSAAGYEFSEQDLKSVSEEVAERPLGDDYVGEVSALFQNGSESFGKELSPEALERLKSAMQQGRFAGYYRPW